MKIVKYFIIVCAVLLGSLHNDIQAATNIVEEQSVQVKCTHVRNIEVYFVNRDGYYTKSNLEYSLVRDAGGNYHVKCKSRYGESYHRVVPSGIRNFKYAFYVSGWFYFN